MPEKRKLKLCPFYFLSQTALEMRVLFRSSNINLSRVEEMELRLPVYAAWRSKLTAAVNSTVKGGRFTSRITRDSNHHGTRSGGYGKPSVWVSLRRVGGEWGSPGPWKPHWHPVGKRNELVCCSRGITGYGHLRKLNTPSDERDDVFPPTHRDV